MGFKTTDLCDANEAGVSVVAPLFRSYGGAPACHGAIATVQCFEDNSRVREALQGPGRGRVLVVDGGGSQRCALLGDLLAAAAFENGWTGVVVNGCVRDSAALAGIGIGVFALATHPRKSVKKGAGTAGQPVSFGGVTFVPGHHLYADADGLLVSPTPLL